MKYVIILCMGVILAMSYDMASYKGLGLAFVSIVFVVAIGVKSIITSKKAIKELLEAEQSPFSPELTAALNREKKRKE